MESVGTNLLDSIKLLEKTSRAKEKKERKITIKGKELIRVSVCTVRVRLYRIDRSVVVSDKLVGRCHCGDLTRMALSDCGNVLISTKKER